MIILEQEPMKRHTTFRIGGPAAYYMVPEEEEEIRIAIEFAREKNLPYYLLGRGSNVLFHDDGYPGVVIEIGRGLAKFEMYKGLVMAQAGISLSAMAAKLAEEGFTGFEFAAGIPGTLGGAITMNAGAYGGEIRDCIVSATVLTEDGDTQVLSREELELGYRSSLIQRSSYIVKSGTFNFEEGDREEIQAKMKELNQKRREKQPLEYPSAGSTFKRPEGHFAGKLIEDAGLKGYRVGDAQVSEKHCGFVVNRGSATAAQVCQLISDVQRKVQEAFGVELEPEIRFVGPF
ncbi:MAG: UDP-N-acetylmuramate dehydrogenase [Lachnospiraceae bacterium]|nr:UDP-N-acetylmuramate dehydrogenase [Lachnospiraceae bacterium]